MRILALLLVAISFSASLRAKDQVADYGGIDGLEIAGNQHFSADEIRASLGADFELFQLDRPDNPAKPFYEKACELVRLGYLSSGFPEAETALTITDKSAKITVKEGPLFRNRAIVIEGGEHWPESLSKESLKKAIRHGLSEEVFVFNEGAADPEARISDSTKKENFEEGELADFSDQKRKGYEESVEQWFIAEGYHQADFSVGMVMAPKVVDLVVTIENTLEPQKVGKFTFIHKLPSGLEEFLLEKLALYTEQPATRTTLKSIVKMLNESFQLRHLSVEKRFDKETKRIDVFLDAVPWSKAWPFDKELSSERKVAYRVGWMIHEIFEEGRSYGMTLKVDHPESKNARTLKLGRMHSDDSSKWGLSVKKSGGEKTRVSEQSIDLGKVMAFLEIIGNPDPMEPKDGEANMGMGISSEKRVSNIKLRFVPFAFFAMLDGMKAQYSEKKNKDGSLISKWMTPMFQLTVTLSSDGRTLENLKMTAPFLPGGYSATLVLQAEALWLAEERVEEGRGLDLVELIATEAMFLKQISIPSNEEGRGDVEDAIELLPKLYRCVYKISSSGEGDQDIVDEFAIPIVSEENFNKAAMVKIALQVNQRLNGEFPPKHRWRNLFRELAHLHTVNPAKKLEYLALADQEEKWGPLKLGFARKWLLRFSDLPGPISAEIVHRSLTTEKLEREVRELYDFTDHLIKESAVTGEELVEVLEGISKLIQGKDVELDFSSASSALGSLHKSGILLAYKSNLSDSIGNNPIEFARGHAKRYEKSFQRLAAMKYGAAYTALAEIAWGEKRIDWAMMNYDFAIEQGHATSAFRAGQLCESKDDDLYTDEQALEYFRKAAELGYTPAEKEVGRLVLEMASEEK